MKRGGLILINDALDGGKVADPAVRDASTNTLRQVGKTLRTNDQLVSTLVPAGNGLLMAVKMPA